MDGLTARDGRHTSDEAGASGMSELQDQADDIVAEYHAVRRAYNDLDPNDPGDDSRREELVKRYHAVNGRYAKLKELAAMSGKQARLVSGEMLEAHAPEEAIDASEAITPLESSLHESDSDSTSVDRLMWGDRETLPLDVGIGRNVFHKLDSLPTTSPDAWLDTENPVEEVTPDLPLDEEDTPHLAVEEEDTPDLEWGEPAPVPDERTARDGGNLIGRSFDRIGALVRPSSVSTLPISELARKGRIQALERALDEGESVDATDETGHTALHHAVKAHRREAVFALVGHGANLDARNDRGDTALYMAAASGDVSLVKYLIEKGGDVTTVNRNGSSLMHVAASTGDVELLRFLDESGLDGQIRSGAGLTPLHFAVEFERPNAVEYLLDCGVDPNAGSAYHESPLCVAARLGQLRILKMLIGAGATVDGESGSKSRDPYSVAVQHHKGRVAAYLRKHCNVS